MGLLRASRVTVFLALCAVVIHAVPPLQSLLQFERATVATGQIWRIITSHFTHWTGDHLLWDIAVFVGLGIACERIDRAKLIQAIIASSVAIPIALLIAQPSLETYRGLSGVDSALLALLAMSLARKRSLYGVVFLAAFLAKSFFELATGQAFFVDTTEGGFVPVPLAHVIGGSCGMIVALWPFAHSRPVTTIAPA